VRTFLSGTFLQASIRSRIHSVKLSFHRRRRRLSANPDCRTINGLHSPRQKTRKFTIKLYSKLPDEDSRANSGQMLSKIGHLQLSIVKLEKTASPIERFESGVASSR
jgi:hypothetical protein